MQEAGVSAGNEANGSVAGGTPVTGVGYVPVQVLHPPTTSMADAVTLAPPLTLAPCDALEFT